MEDIEIQVTAIYSHLKCRGNGGYLSRFLLVPLIRRMNPTIDRLEITMFLMRG